MTLLVATEHAPIAVNDVDNDPRVDATTMHALGIRSLMAVIAPLLLLFGLKHGVVSQLQDELLRDPRNLEVKMLSSGHYDQAWLERLQQRPDVGFAIGQTRSLNTQADLLSSLGTSISPRSDTFTIRAMGEAKNDEGKVEVRVWCEAVIQRGADYVDPADGAATALASLKQPINARFGRRFDVVSFRWLNPEEVKPVS